MILATLPKMLLQRETKKYIYSHEQETGIAPTQARGFPGRAPTLSRHCFHTGEHCRASEDKPLWGLNIKENVSKGSFLPMQQNGL